MTLSIEQIVHRNHIATADELIAFLSKSVKLSINGRQTCINFLRQSLAAQITAVPRIENSKDFGNYLAEKYADLPREEFHVISLSNSNQIVGDDCVAKGTISRAIVDAPMIFSAAIEHHATGIILTHNHPSGSLIPSEADRHMTMAVIKVGKLMQIPVLDHIITSNGDYCSFAEHGWMK